ncbi:hypothetical protein D3C84_1246910 [compost metagenome]
MSSEWPVKVEQQIIMGLLMTGCVRRRVYTGLVRKPGSRVKPDYSKRPLRIRVEEQNLSVFQNMIFPSRLMLNIHST